VSGVRSEINIGVAAGSTPLENFVVVDKLSLSGDSSLGSW